MNRETNSHTYTHTEVQRAVESSYIKHATFDDVAYGIQWAEMPREDLDALSIEELEAFQDKMEFLEQYAEPLTPKEFYRVIFSEGSFERKGHPEDNRPNGLIVARINDDKHKTFAVYDALEEIDRIKGADFAVMAPVSYIGRTRKAVNARYLHALAFDIDDVSIEHMATMFHQFDIGLLPKPTLLVNSGHGVHLYYVFEEPIALYEPVQKTLKEIKFALTNVLWTRHTSADKKVQYQGIFQPFRIPGTVTKFKNSITLEAFKVGEKTTLYELLAHLRYQAETIDIMAIEPLIQREEKAAKPLKLFNTNETSIQFNSKESKIKRIKTEFDISNLKYKSRLGLKEAKEKYPEWYIKTIMNGDKKKGRWVNHRGLYEWWKKKIAEEAVAGGRYFAIMALAIYAKKCDVDIEELYDDAMSFIEPFNKLTDGEYTHKKTNKKKQREPFTEDDVNAALGVYEDKFVTFPRRDIEKLTQIEIPPNKRNGRKQDEHLKRARAVRDIDHPDGTWMEGNGRKSKAIEIATFVAKNPGLTPTEYAKALGVSRPTVYKYLKR